MGCHALLQEIFPSQGSNLCSCSPALQVDPLPTELPGKPPRGAYLCVLLSHFSRVRLCVTPWTAVCQAPLSLGFSRQEYLSGLPCPPPGDLLTPGLLHLSGVRALLQATFSPQAPSSRGLSHPGLPHCRKILHRLSRQGSQGRPQVLWSDSL